MIIHIDGKQIAYETFRRYQMQLRARFWRRIRSTIFCFIGGVAFWGLFIRFVIIPLVGKN